MIGGVFLCLVVGLWRLQTSNRQVGIVSHSHVISNKGSLDHAYVTRRMGNPWSAGCVQ